MDKLLFKPKFYPYFKGGLSNNVDGAGCKTGTEANGIGCSI